MSESGAPVFDPSRPIFAPILHLPDRDSIVAGPPLAAAVLPSTCAVRPPLARLLEVARRRTSCLIVDPRTPYFQYEGYMGMEDLRALSYGPGGGTLGQLWVPDDFASADARGRLTSEVLALQRSCGADVLLPPYFFVREAEHPWLEVNRDFAAETLDRGAPEPLGVAIAVRLDAITGAEDRRRVLDAYSGLHPDVFWVTVVDYDEIQASPAEVRAVLDLIAGLGAGGSPVLPAYLGRTGLVAIARGAAGYCSGLRGLETHPLANYREGLGGQTVNLHYLRQHLMHLRAPLAESVLAASGDGGDRCDCAACADGRRVGLMVTRRLISHALHCHQAEVAELVAVPAAGRIEALRGRFATALAACRDAAATLASVEGGPTLPHGAFHYLEVLVEITGGPPATIPIFEDF